jgi:hypothetical protein
VQKKAGFPDVYSTSEIRILYGSVVLTRGRACGRRPTLRCLPQIARHGEYAAAADVTTLLPVAWHVARRR